jgi:hypothetical protein
MESRHIAQYGRNSTQGLGAAADGKQTLAREQAFPVLSRTGKRNKTSPVQQLANVMPDSGQGYVYDPKQLDTTIFEGIFRNRNRTLQRNMEFHNKTPRNSQTESPTFKLTKQPNNGL